MGLAEEEANPPMNVCGVTAARSRVCVSSYRVYFLSGCSHGISDLYERERRERGGGGMR